MHKPLVIATVSALVALAGSSASATDLASLPWEASPDSIRRQMASDPSATAVKDSANHLSYRGGTLAGQPVQAWRWTPPAPGAPPQLAVRFVSSDARPALYRELGRKYGSPDEFQNSTRRDALWTTGPSATVADMTGNVLLTVVTSGRDTHTDLTFFDSPTPAGPRSDLRYTLRRDPHPTPAQLDAYVRITDAMDRAVRFYDRYTVGIVKTDTVFLDPGEATAEGNVNGDIRFGPTDISLRTALHEMSHTVGIGTTPQYHRLTVNERFIGKHALAQLRAITGDDHAILHADTWHFWAYGLNHVGEDDSIWDYIHHCQMVSAILQDCRELQ